MSKLFFIGDSITAGAWDDGGGWVNRLIGQIMQKTIATNFEDDGFYCLPYNLGVSGDTIEDVLKRIETEIAVRVNGDEDPNETIQIVCAIGINDTQYFATEDRLRFSADEFKENIQALITISKKIAQDVKFIGLTPVVDHLLNPMPWAPDKAYVNEYVQAFEAHIFHMCQVNNVSFLPLFDTWITMPNWKDYLIDGVHPNSKGHALLAEQIGTFLLTDEFEAFNTS